MLNKPKFMSPSINMYGNSVIDLNSATLPFSCIIDGNEAITDFQIVVSKLSDNTVVFDTGMKTLDKPFFPINNRNQNVVFSINLKDYFNAESEIYYKPATSDYDETKTYYKFENDNYVISNPNFTNWSSNYKNYYYVDFVNSVDAYYWAITLKNSNSGTKTYSVAEVFYANSIPETEIYYSYNNDFSNSSRDLDGESLQKRKIYFKSTYSQPEGIMLKRYGWRLTDTTNNVIVMDTITQNQIYGIADDISCVCNGLINQTNYQLELYIETQNGYFDVLQSKKFNVNYPIKNIDVDFEVIALNDTAGIMLNWGNLRTTEGVVIGDSVRYVENFPIQSSASIEIPDNTSVVFKGTSSEKDLEIDENSYVVLSFQTKKNENKVLFEMSGEDSTSSVISRKLETIVVDGTPMLRYTIRKGDIVATKQYPLTPNVDELSWHVVTLPPLIGETIDFKIVESIAIDGLFPSEDLYPEDLYIYDELGNIIEGEYNRAQETYDSNLSYFKLVDGVLVEYVYNDKTWNSDWVNLFCCLHPHFGEWNKLRNQEVVNGL